MENSRFGNLPPELRNIIYALVFDPESEGIELEPDPPEQPYERPLTMRPAFDPLDLNITRTCRQIRQESLGIAFRSINPIEYSDIEAHLAGWLESLGNTVSLFRELSLTACYVQEHDGRFYEDEAMFMGRTLVHWQRLFQKHGIRIKFKFELLYDQLPREWHFSDTIYHGVDVYDSFDKQTEEYRARVDEDNDPDDAYFLTAARRLSQLLRLYRDMDAEGYDLNGSACYRRARYFYRHLD